MSAALTLEEIQVWGTNESIRTVLLEMETVASASPDSPEAKALIERLKVIQDGWFGGIVVDIKSMLSDGKQARYLASVLEETVSRLPEIDGWTDFGMAWLDDQSASFREVQQRLNKIAQQASDGDA